MNRLEDSNFGRMKDAPLAWQMRGMRQTTSGYGSKLTTRYKIEYCGRFYRVYVICHSNVAGYYVVVKGQDIYIPNCILNEEFAAMTRAG